VTPVKRVLAVVAAVLMIGGALLIRSRIDSRDEAADLEASKAVVVCAAELGPVCDELRRTHPELTTRTEEASVTAASLSGSGFSREATPIDAWLVPRPFPAMVDENRSFASLDPVLGDATAVLARSPLTLTVWNDRLEALRTACPEVNWVCIGEHAGQPWKDIGAQESWGPVKPGLPDPSTTAFGLLGLSQATAQQLGRADYASNDLQDPAFQTWLDQLKRSIRSYPPSATGGPLGQMLSQGKGTFDAAGSAEAVSGPGVTTSRNKNELTVLYPSPVVTADVVLVEVRGSESGGHAREVFESDEAAAILAAKGWRVDGQAPAPGVLSDPLPPSDGLPKPGAVKALLDAWKAT
jgi:hypothetical protein